MALLRRRRKPDFGELVKPADEVSYDSIFTLGSSYQFAMPEYKEELRGREGIRTYDRMRRSDPQVRGSLRMVKAPVLTSTWYSQPAANNPQEIEQAQLLWWSYSRIRRSFPSLLREALSSLDFGYYGFEMLWETVEWTPPPTLDRPRPRPRMVTTWKDWSPIHPIKVYGYKYDKDGYVDTLLVGPKSTPVPWDKVAWFSFDNEGDDPVGMSILRSAYQPWFYKTRLYNVDAVQKERHATGIPRVKLKPGHSQKDRQFAIEMAQNLRTNEKSFVVELPSFEVDFLRLEGQPVNVMDSIKEHGLMILENVLTQFMALGTHETGSRNVGATQSSFFEDATRFVIDYMRGVFNDKAKELIGYNYDGVAKFPELRARRFDDNRMRALSVGIMNFVNSGVLTGTPEFEQWLCDYLDFPFPSDQALTRDWQSRLPQSKQAGQGDSPTDGPGGP